MPRGVRCVVDFRELADGGASCSVGPLEGVLFVFRAASTDVIRERLASAPWLRDVTLSIVGIERWTTVLDGLAIRVR